MLKVMTLNLNYYMEKHGSWDDRLDLIVDAIQNAQPDLIAFQAVRRDPQTAEGTDQAAQIASRLSDYPYIYFQPAVTYSGGSAEGSAFLSKYSAVDVDCRELSLRAGTDDPTHRNVLHARFDLPTGPFHLFNAHFSWVDEQAMDNLEESLPFLASFTGQRMLVGDLNAVPDSEVMNRFKQAGWTDAWAVLRPDEDGYTFESNERSKRIDYVWVDESLINQLQSIRTVADMESPKGVRASDHIGLLVELSSGSY